MSYKMGTYKYFDLLVVINNYYLKPKNIGDNVRENKLEIILYNDMIQKLFFDIYVANNIEEIIEIILNLAGFLWLRQPFYDGNTRTIISFIEIIFKTLNYDIKKKEYENDIIPIFYYDNEKCTKNDILKFQRKLQKINLYFLFFLLIFH